MQVFIECLRRTETAAVAQTQVDVFRRIIAQVGTRTENHVFHQIVLVDTCANQETPLLVFPFILEETAIILHNLVRSQLQAKRTVVKIVIVEFRSNHQIGRHEQQFVERIGIVSARRYYEVGRRSIGFLCCCKAFFRLVARTAVIAVAVRILER